MALDGVVLSTTRTAIKRVTFPPFGFEAAYFFQAGIVLSPSELSMGAHDLDAMLVFPPDTFNEHITFFIDPPETGACL